MCFPSEIAQSMLCNPPPAATVGGAAGGAVGIAVGIAAAGAGAGGAGAGADWPVKT